ncbi:MAG: flagellar brake domain-containing protein, partial [Phycisphaerales bacterium]|nr:flagellar brake domain-containing protein [Phycisphaerales bacterium]
MPANRSRTERWRDGLQQIFERHGGIEISVASDDDQPDLIWRVRILRLTDDEIVVERPSAMGATFDLCEGTALVGGMVIGQNRWMFHTEVTGVTE